MHRPRALVVYYSFEGNTRYVAEQIADELGADLLELRTDDEPGTKGFMKYVWGGRQVMTKQKPALFAYRQRPEDYELLVIGTPVWAGNYAPALRTFFESVKVKGKSVAVFSTHQGGRGRTLENMKQAMAGNNVVGERDFMSPLKNEAASAQTARSWARELLGA